MVWQMSQPAWMSSHWAFGGLAGGHDAGRGELVGGVGGGVDQADALGFERVGDGVENRLGAAVVAEAREPEPGRRYVGNITEECPRVVHLGLENAADHDGVGAAGGFEDSGPAAEARDADEMEFIAFVA